MDKLRKALSGQDSRDNDSSTGILPVSNIFYKSTIIVFYYFKVYLLNNQLIM